MLQQCLTTFLKAFGLFANLGKSSIYFGGLTQAEQGRILSKLGFTIGEFPFQVSWDLSSYTEDLNHLMATSYQQKYC